MIDKVRVVATKRGLICPRCGAGCYALVFRDGWGCRRCAGAKYRSKYRPSPMHRRQSLLRALVRADPLTRTSARALSPTLSGGPAT
jgi:ribosomal protein S27AE